MLAGSKIIFFNLQLTRNSGRISEADIIFPHSGTLGGNSGAHAEQESGNHSDPY